MGIEIAGKVKKQESNNYKPACSTHRNFYLDSMNMVETNDKKTVVTHEIIRILMFKVMLFSTRLAEASSFTTNASQGSRCSRPLVLCGPEYQAFLPASLNR